MQPLVTIVMPAFNAEKYIDEAVRSVIAQSHTNWELLIVNDGSTDGTVDAIAHHTDPRIRVFHQSNSGIGKARNTALEHARGSFMCGLDADDVLPADSLTDRLAVFDADPSLDIVDGCVLFMDGTLDKVLRTFRPRFNGEPFHELVALTGACFMGFSWLVRWNPQIQVRFVEHMTHGEDLCFYLAYSPGKRYGSAHSTVLLYRRTGTTTMNNLHGLARSYTNIHVWLRKQGRASTGELKNFRRLTRWIMIKSFLRAGHPVEALRTLLDLGTFAPF